MHTFPAIPLPLYKIVFFLQPFKYIFGNDMPLLQESIFPWFTDRIKTQLADDTTFWKSVMKTFKGTLIYYSIIVQITVLIKISVSYVLKETLISLSISDGFFLGILLFCQVLFEQHYFQNIYQMSAKIRATVQQVLIHKLQRISASRLEDGQLFNIMTMDLSDLDITWLIAFTGAPIICLIGMYLLWLSFGFCFLVGIFSLCGLMIVQKYITKKTGPLKTEKSKLQDIRTKLTTEILQNLPQIKMMSLESLFRDKLLSARQEQDDKTKQILKIDALAYCLNGNINVFVSLLLMLLSYLIFNDEYPSSEDIFASIWILQLFKVWCITYGQRAYKLIINLRVLHQRITDLLAIPELDIKTFGINKKTTKHKKKKYLEIEEEESVETIEEQQQQQQQQGSVLLTNFSAYWTKLQEMQNQPVLDKLNLNIDSARFITITGQVGSGKSSFLLSLINEIPYTSGSVNVTGHLAYVEQRPFLFPGTLKANILFGHPYNEKLYNEVLQQSGLDKDNIIDTFDVGENGSRLSGGQKLRVSLSRALYSDADVYLIDDVLSAVDAKVQEIILNSLYNLKKEGKIIILCTSRNVRCDACYKMDNGKLIQIDNVAEENEINDINEQPQQEQQNQEQQQVLVNNEVYKKYLQEGGQSNCILIAILYLVDAGLSFLIIKQFGEMNLLLNFTLMIFYVIINFNKFNQMFGFTLTVINTMHRKLISAIVRMKLTNYDNVGRLMSRFTSDLNNIEGMVMLDLHWVVEGLIDNIFVILLVSLNSYIIILSIIFLILMLSIKNLFHQKMEDSLNLDDVTRGNMYSLLQSSIKGSLLIRVYNQQPRIIEEYLNITYKNLQASFTFLRLNALLAFIIELSLHILIIFVLFILISSGYDSQIVGFSILMLMQLGYMFSLNLRGQIFLDIDMQNAARVYQTIEIPSENYNDGIFISNWPSEGKIEFRNISLQYPGSQKQVLKHIKILIEPNQSIGLMGRTGSGKSSLINLLLRIVDPTEGEILIDGVNIASVSLSQLRDNILVIPQQSNVFNSSIRINLDPFNEYTDEDIQNALQKVNLKEVVESIGLHKQEYNLSVGQQQLLQLARAFLHPSKIIIFDEATANIDQETEQQVEKALQSLESTKIIIAHSDKIVSHCNSIINLQNGSII